MELSLHKSRLMGFLRSRQAADEIIKSENEAVGEERKHLLEMTKMHPFALGIIARLNRMDPKKRRDALASLEQGLAAMEAFWDDGQSDWLDAPLQPASSEAA